MSKTEVKLIPVPKSITGSGEYNNLSYYLYTDMPEWQSLIDVTQSIFEKIYDEKPEIRKGGIELLYDAALAENEYRLCMDDTLKLFASSYEGASYAMSSAVQLVKKESYSFSAPSYEIQDSPDKEMRGFMIDLARWWHSKRQVLAYIDLCFFYKMKYIHLHFVDDQSYTLPSRAFPKLSTPGRTYTEDDIKEIRDYAKARGISIIPEMEFPGHAKQLNLNYPEIFSDPVDNFEEKAKASGEWNNECQYTKWESVLCVGSKTCYNAVLKLIDELLELFPDSPYIHLGGDEAAIRVWEYCPICQKYMKEHNIDDVQALQCEFIGRISRYIISKGRTPILWEGFTKEFAHFIPKEAIVMVWNGTFFTAEDLLSNGFKVINAAWKPLYITPTPGLSVDIKEVLLWNIYTWQHYFRESDYCLNPHMVQKTDSVVGAFLYSWEAPYEYDILQIIENMAAVSERIWSERRYRDDNEFMSALHSIRNRAFRIILEK